MKQTDNTMERNTFQKVIGLTVDKLLEMKAAAKVTSQPIEKDGVTVIPVSKISMGFAGGGADISDMPKGKSKNPAGAGAGISETPVTFLVLDGEKVTLLKPPAQAAAPAGTDLLQTAVGLFQKFKKQK